VKLHPQCIACQVNVRYRDLERVANISSDVKLHAMKGVLEIIQGFLNNCLSNKDICIPTELATKLFRYIKHVLNNPDPYFEYKVRAHREALKIYEIAKKVVFLEKEPRIRLYRALQFSLAGNLLDIGVSDYISPKIEEIMNRALDLQIYGDIDKALNLLLKSRNVVMILDNAGEAVFDRLIADVLRSGETKVYAVIKGGAFQNDVTVTDAKVAMLSESFDGVYDTGSDASSIFLQELKEEVKVLIKNSDVIFSKGMANYEYITEVAEILRKPIVYALVAKCLPISIDSGIPLGKAGVRIYVP